MIIPVYKIELWDTTPALLHTVTHDALSIRVKEVVTENVGTFSFALPTLFGDSYKYDDVTVGDTAKIWLNYNSVGATPLSIGKIYDISPSYDLGSGYVRVFSGKNQGEILKRRFKTERWEATEASIIIAELATDLGLGVGDIEATVGKSVTYQADDKKYWDILKDLSDYWISGGNELNKDYYVDVDNDLVWAERDGTAPFRSGADVESLTVGLNVLNYIVSHDMNQLYNKITVYGAAEKPTQNNKDAYCEATTNGHTWAAPEGGAVATNANSYLGGWSIMISEAATNVLVVTCAFEAVKSALFKKEFRNLHFSTKIPAGAAGSVGTISIRFRRAITSNYFATILTPDHHGLTIGGDWKTFTIPIGIDRQVASGLTGYNGEWYASGSPLWDDLNGIMFRFAFTNNDDHVALIDAVYLGEARYSDTAEDSTSQTDYGIKELVVIDDNLRSDSECEAMAESLIDLHKDPALQIELFTHGNPNIIVGDRLSMTLPAEGISAQNFDVFQVEHCFDLQNGYITKAVMNSSNKQRRKIPTNVTDVAVQTAKLSKEAWMLKRVVS